MRSRNVYAVLGSALFAFACAPVQGGEARGVDLKPVRLRYLPTKGQWLCYLTDETGYVTSKRETGGSELEKPHGTEKSRIPGGPDETWLIFLKCNAEKAEGVISRQLASKEAPIWRQPNEVRKDDRGAEWKRIDDLYRGRNEARKEKDATPGSPRLQLGPLSELASGTLRPTLTRLSAQGIPLSWPFRNGAHVIPNEYPFDLWPWPARELFLPSRPVKPGATWEVPVSYEHESDSIIQDSKEICRGKYSYRLKSIESRGGDLVAVIEYSWKGKLECHFPLPPRERSGRNGEKRRVVTGSATAEGIAWFSVNNGWLLYKRERGHLERTVQAKDNSSGQAPTRARKLVRTFEMALICPPPAK